MRRVLVILALVVLGGGAFVSLGAGDDEAGTYEIIFDNAFGLVEGADFKVGGVAVGSIEKLDLQRRDMRARVTVSAQEQPGFGGLRSDARCVIAPQSLIGEYFVDCQPGTKGRKLDAGGTIPVRQTESPIPPDLVLNVMRLPERERFRIIFNELGAGLAARGGDLNETIRRAIPAIGATNRVLKTLADNRQTLAALSRDSGRVLRVLGERREDLGRFITSSRRLAQTTATRRAELAETFRRFPGFLRELTPTMADLGTTARLQTPALADLRAAAPSVNTLLTTLRPFTRALRPATTSLGEASGSGRTAARASRTLLRNLASLGQATGEPANNLAILLSDLDDRDRAAEPDPDSPGGRGYTGFESLLQYVFDQTMSINIFDQRGYSLKLNINVDECSEYTSAVAAREDMERYRRCTQALGPNQPGITTPDPSPGGPATARAGRRRAEPAPSAERKRTVTKDAPERDREDGGGSKPEPQGPLDKPLAPGLPPVQQLLDKVPELLDPLKDDLGRAQELGKSLDPKKRPSGGGDAGSAQDLLDFLLAP